MSKTPKRGAPGQERGARARQQRRLLEELAEELDPAFFKALGDPARVELLKLLVVEGPMDIDAIARLFPQDRSVISRHLASLRNVGVLSHDKRGRHVYYSANASFFIERLERILERMRALQSVCCPPP